MSDQVREIPAPRNPVARLVGVLTSPGEAFKEIAQSPGWLPPFLIFLAFFIVGFCCFAFKADWIAIVTDQIESSPFMKLVPDANHDTAIANATEGLRKLTRGQLVASNLINAGSFQLFFYHLLALIHITLFVMMGSLKDLKLGRAWGRFLLCLLAFVGYLVVYGIARFAFKDSQWSMLLLVGAAAIAMLGGWAWLLDGLAKRDVDFHKMLTVCMYSTVALMISLVAFGVLSMVHQGDIQTAPDKLVPSNLDAILQPDNAILKTLFSSLDIFWIWFFLLLTIGYRAVTRLSFGMAASMTFLPWGIIVMIKVAWAAVFG